MSLKDAADVLSEQAAGRLPKSHTQIMTAALALDVATMLSSNRDLLDAAIGLRVLATTGKLQLDEAGRQRARYLAELVMALDWREQHGYLNRGGVVIFFNGEVQGWVDELRNPEHWQPGCIAVDNDGQSWRASGGTKQNGAKVWKLLRSHPQATNVNSTPSQN